MTVFNIGYSEISEAWGDLTKKKKKKSQQDPICDLYESKGSTSAYTETDLVNYNYDKSRYQRTVKDEPIKMHVDVNKDQDNYESKQLPNSIFEKQFELRHPNSFDVEDPTEFMVSACPATKALHKRSDKPDRIYDDEVVKLKQKSLLPPPPQTDEEEEDDEVFQEYFPKPKDAPTCKPTKPEYKYYSRNNSKYSDYEDEEPARYRRAGRESFYDSDYEDEDSYFNSRKKKKGTYVYLDILLYVLSGIILIFLLEQFVKIGIHMQQQI